MNDKQIAKYFPDGKIVYPLDDEKDLEIDYNCEWAVICELKEACTFDAPQWLPDIKYGVVTHVYDGDTFHLVSIPKNGDGKWYKFVIRLRGIDTPELNIPEQKEKGLEAKQALIDMMLTEVVMLTKIDKDKYGRILADVWKYNKEKRMFAINVTNELINKGLGKRYYGGKKA